MKSFYIEVKDLKKRVCYLLVNAEDKWQAEGAAREVLGLFPQNHDFFLVIHEWDTSVEHAIIIGG